MLIGPIVSLISPRSRAVPRDLAPILISSNVKYVRARAIITAHVEEAAHVDRHIERKVARPFRGALSVVVRFLD